MEAFSVQVTIKNKPDWIKYPKKRWNHALVLAGHAWKDENRHNPGKGSGQLARASTYKITYGESIQLQSTFYWIFLMKGTGIYGPSGNRIFPVRAKVLAWQGHGAGMMRISSGVGYRKGKPFHQPSRDVSMVFAKSVAGTIWPGRLDAIILALQAAFRDGLTADTMGAYLDEGGFDE